MRHRLTTVCLAVTLLLGLLGCQTNEPGVKNRFGTFEANLSGTTEEVTAAAHRALQGMNLTILEHESTMLDGRVVALTAQQERVTIGVERVDDQTSRIGIRVGTFGDGDTSVTILDRIKRHLAAPR